LPKIGFVLAPSDTVLVFVTYCVLCCLLQHPVYRYRQGWAPEFGYSSYWKFRNPLSYFTAKLRETVDLRKIFVRS